MKSVSQEIIFKAKKSYEDFLWITASGECDFFPKKIPIEKLSSKLNFEELRRKISDISSIKKQEGRPGPEIRYRKVATHRYGNQSIPSEVLFTSFEDYIHFIGKKKESDIYFNNFKLMEEKVPELIEWSRQKKAVSFMVKNGEVWSDLLHVCRYFLDHFNGGLYARQIPLDIHTKFIEENKAILRILLDHCLPPDKIDAGEKDFLKRFKLRSKPILVRCRILDSELNKKLGLSFTDIAVPVDELSKWDGDRFLSGVKLLIVENEIPFLTLPDLPNVIAFFGKGFAVETLHKISFFKSFPIYYWGDIDTQGLEILSQFRKSFSQTQSIFMSLEVFDKFKQWCSVGKERIRGVELKLTSPEQELFELLHEKSLRLEQERIPQKYIDETLKAIFSSNSSNKKSS